MEAGNVKIRDFEPDRLRRQGDKIIVGALWILSVYCFAIEPLFGTWFEAIIVGLPGAIIPHITAGRLQP